MTNLRLMYRAKAVTNLRLMYRAKAVTNLRLMYRAKAVTNLRLMYRAKAATNLRLMYRAKAVTNLCFGQGSGPISVGELAAEEMKHPSYTVQETLLVSMIVLTEKILVLSVKQVRCLKMCNDGRLFVVIPFFFLYSLLENWMVCMIPHNHRYRYIYI